MAGNRCEQCNATGLPLLPLRYVVVPKNVKPELPEWANTERLVHVFALSDDYHYALRTLRRGFVYIFYSVIEGHGTQVWECYSVTNDGCLVKQMDAGRRVPVGASVQCSRNGHSHARLRHLVIESPQLCGKTWIAFSEHPWSRATRLAYEKDEARRDQRMRVIYPARLAERVEHKQLTPASQQALESVLEYAPGFDERVLPFEGKPQRVSNSVPPDGSYRRHGLEAQSASIEWHLRADQAAGDVEAMHLRGRRADGVAPHPGVLIALWDAIGVARDLHGYYVEPTARVQQYGDELALQIAATVELDAVRKLVTQPAIERAQAGIAQRKHHEQQQAACASHGHRDGRLMLSEQQDIQAQIDSAVVQTAAGRAWSRYEQLLDAQAMAVFKRNSEKFVADATRLTNERAVHLANWLQTPICTDTLADDYVNDGVAYQTVVGEVTCCLGDSVAGAQLLDTWIKGACASDRKNLLWRALALNSAALISEVDKGLKLVFGDQVLGKADSQTWGAIDAQIKWNKLDELFKKAFTADNHVTLAATDPMGRFNPVSWNGALQTGITKFFTTVSLGLERYVVGKPIDALNALVLRGMLLAACGIDHRHVAELVGQEALVEHAHTAQAKDGLSRLKASLNPWARSSTASTAPTAPVVLRRLIQSQWQEQVEKSYVAEMRASMRGGAADLPWFNAGREARLTQIFGIFEVANLAYIRKKLEADPQNAALQRQFYAASATTISIGFDLMANFTSGLAAVGSNAGTYQFFKSVAVATSMSASVIGTYMDYESAVHALQREDRLLGNLYLVRMFAQGSNTAVAAALGLSYIGPKTGALSQFLSRLPEKRLLGRGVGARLIAWVVDAGASAAEARVALLVAGLDLALILVGLTIFIAIVEKNGLEKWCDNCAFARKRRGLSNQEAHRRLDSYADAQAQHAALVALMGSQPDEAPEPATLDIVGPGFPVPRMRVVPLIPDA